MTAKLKTSRSKNKIETPQSLPDTPETPLSNNALPSEAKFERM